MKVEFVSVDELGKHYSLRTADGKVHFGRDYLDSCFLKPRGQHFENLGFDLHLDEGKAKARIARREAKKKKF